MIGFLIVTGVLISIIIILMYIMSLLNFEHENRFRQAAFVIITSVYVLAVSVGFLVILTVTDVIISVETITDIVLTGVPAESYGAAFMLMILLVSNVIVLIGADIILFVLRHIVAERELASYRLMLILERFTGKFYIIEPSMGTAFLKKEHRVTMRWVDVMRKSVLVFFLVLAAFSFFSLYADFIIDGRLLLQILKYSYILVMSTYIILTQFYYFLDGIAEDEVLSEFESDRIVSRRTGDYEKLLEVYRKKFGDGILNNGQHWIENEKMEEHVVFNGVSRLQVEKSRNGDVFELVVGTIKRHCDKLTASYVEAVLDLIDKKSVMIKDSIFGEFAIYMAGFLDYQLAMGKKIIVIAPDRKRAKDIAAMLKRRFRKINDVNAVWRIDTFSEFHGSDDTDILVCCSEDLDPVDENEFIRCVRCVVVDDPDSIYASGMITKRIIHARLSSMIDDGALQYIYLCDESNRNLEESIEHTIGQSITTYQNILTDKRICVVVWKGEPYVRLQDRLNLKGAYMGTGYPLAVVGARYGVRNIGMWCTTDVPYMTYREIMNDNIDFIRSNIFKDSGINMNEIIHVNDVKDYEEDTLKFLILYDEANNMIALLHNWLKYGGKESTMIHVVSRPYMLREYFAENLRKLLGTPSEIKRLIPYKGCDIQRQKEILLIGMYEGSEGKPDYEIINVLDEFRDLGYAHDDIESYLYQLLYSVCPESGIRPETVYDYFSVKPKGRFEFADGKCRFNSYNEVRFIDADSYRVITERYDFAAIRYGGTDKLQTIAVHADDIYNHYLPLQIHCFNGELYQVEKISGREILIRKSSPKNVPQYRTIDRCEGSISEKKLLYILEDKYRVTELKADITKTIEAYYELSDGCNFKEAPIRREGTGEKAAVRSGTYSKVTFPEPLVMNRTQKKGIELQLQVSGMNKEKDELLLAAMFSEILKTIYPDSYRDLMVCVERTEEMERLLESVSDEDRRVADIISMITFKNKTFPASATATIYIFEMSYLEKGLIGELSDKDNIENIFDIMYSYLKWELGKKTENGYLKYGLADYPAIFDVKEYMSYLENIRLKPEDAIDGDDEGATEDVFEGASICPYCGRAIYVEFNMTSDGKFMCDDCVNQIVGSRIEIEKVYKEAKKQMEDFYHIELPRIKAFRFKGLDDIQKAAGDKYAIGFYSPRKVEIWVERYVPETYMMAVLIHELTHSWQFANLSDAQLSSDSMLEGHAKYVEIETLRRLKEERYADYLEKMLPRLDGGPDNPYNVGYQKMQELVKEHGSENIFYIMKHLETENVGQGESNGEHTNEE